jgi:hypothetical protein
LKKFYRKAHPLGLWQPVRRAIEAEDGVVISTPKLLIPSGFLVAAIGAIMLIFSVLCISFLFVANWKSGLICGVMAFIFAIAFKFTFKWHIDRMALAAPIEKHMPSETLKKA